ncbi:MAG: FxsA family protein [Euzebyales bacterium]|nr:FxsA family protein [Euzebyales bacterium]
MPLVLLLAFIVVPLVELAVIVQVADVITLPWTIVILLAVSVAGAWLVKREGRTAWRNFRRALEAARIPAVEVVDGALVLVGGALLLTPGFVTDAVGLLLVFPPSRAVVNRVVRSRVRSVAFGRFGARPRTAGGEGPRPRVTRQRGETIDVEVVDVQRNPRERQRPPTQI